MRLADVFRRARGAFNLTDRLFRLRERLAAPTKPQARPRTRLGCEAFEERVVPARPLPYPVFAVAPESGGAGIVKMYDAESGAELLSLRPFPEFTGGIRVAVADLTGDKYPDLIVGAGPGGGPRVRVYDGKSGQPLAGTLGSFFAYSSTFSGGVQLAAGDVTGDGVPDLLTAADTGGGPHVKVFDGTDGDEVDSFYAFESEFTGGVRLAAGDLTGDGVAEIVLGAGAGGAPRVRVLDAATLDPIDGPLGDFYAFEEEDRSGVYVAAADLTADVTGDGFQDLVVGAGAGRTADVIAYDSVTGDVAFTTVAFGGSYTGGARVGTLYADDDEYADIAVGSGPGITPQVTVLSPLTGEPVTSWLGSFAAAVGSTALGVNLAAGNDPPPPGGGGAIMTGSFRMTPSSSAVLVGQEVEVAGHLMMEEDNFSTTGTANFGNSTSGSYSGGAGSGVFDYYVDDGAETVAYTSAGTYTYSVSGEATKPGFITFEYGGSVSVTAVDLPPDLAVTLGSGETTGGVRAVDGVINVVGPGLTGGGYGSAVGGAWQWSSNSGYSASANGGDGWADAGATRLVRDESDTDIIVLLTGAGAATYFDGTGSPDGDGNYPTYVARREKPWTLTFDSGSFVLDANDGGTTVYKGFGSGLSGGEAGAFQSRVEPGGATHSVTERDLLGRPTKIERNVTEGGITTYERYTTEYLPETGQNTGRAWKQTLERKVGSGSWATVRTLEYLYYTPSEAGGTLGDLKRADLKDGSGNVLDQWYYRYDSIGRLTHAVGTEAYGRLKAYAGGTDTDVEAASDATVELYADLFIEYDSNGRVVSVTKSAAGCSMCAGGQGEYTYAYTASSNTAGPNSWKTKVVETQPDGTTNTYYANALGGVMMKVHSESSLAWIEYTKFDSDYRPVLVAEPSAMTGYSDSYADLVNTVSNNAQYVADSAGLVTVMAYGSSTTATDTTAGNAEGFLSNSAIRQGETGTDVPQSAVTYFRKTAGDATTTVVATQTRYVNDNGTGAETRSYAYTWQSGTVQPASIAVTLPTVTTAQNGPNAATTATTVYDSYGRATWSKDQAGFISYTAYDTPTGEVVKQITDVDTTQTGTFANLPSGWTTPGGGGLHLTTTYVVDSLGRRTKTTMPNGRVDYTVYNDAVREIRTYPGWDSVSNVPTGPTMVVREDRAGNYVEMLSMSVTPSVSSGQPTGAESIATLQSLSRSVRNAVGQAIYSDAYFDLTSLTYSTSTTLGTLNSNYYRTETDYGKQSTLNRTVTPLGTITRTEYDGLGRQTSKWVGTDDTPTTGFWSVSNTTGTNMVKVQEYEYDGGAIGDSNLTKVTQIPGGGAVNRVTQTWFDWRDRPVAVKAGVESSESTDVNRPLSYSDYDNLGRVTTVRSYDADTVTPSVSGGVPVAPSSSLLRAKSATAYDALGRVFRSSVYSVDPSSGSVAANILHTDTWYDERGLTIKTLSPGGLVQKTVYDGAGRATVQYATDGGGQRASDLTAGGFGRLFGDINGDGAVSSSPDQTAYNATLNLALGDPGFEPAFDRNGDDSVDFLDTPSFTANLGLSLAGTIASPSSDVVLTVNGGAAQRSRVTTASVDCGPGVTVSAGAFSLTGVGIDGTTPLTAPTVSQSVAIVDGRTVATLTFSGTGVVASSLPDGTWTLIIDKTKVNGDIGWSDAKTVSGDTVLEQSETTYDGNGNVLTTALRRRFHDASGTGALGTPSSGVAARVSYMGYYYDKADRPTATADVGTNPVSGTPSAWTRPGSIPSRSDAVLVTSQTYDAAGRTYETTDPMGTVGRTLYDALGRTTKTIQNYVDGTVSDGDDKTTEYTYNAAGMTSLTAKLTGGGGQTTEWVYGVTTGGGSAVNSNDVVGATRWPEPSTGAASSGQQDTVTVNALGQTVTSADRNGTVHTYTYDVLGRVTADAATTIGSGVDGSVRRIGTEYDGQGNPYRITSYDSASSGSVVNQVQRLYNGLEQLVTEYQAVTGGVNTSTTPKVQYAYMEMVGGVNNSRQTSMTYPSGYELTSNYASGLNSDISRLTSLSDTTGTMESYEYLGLSTLIKRTHPQPGVDLTYLKLSGESNGDAGDQYTGLDRFDRVVDQRWVKTSDGSAIDRFEYGYDRAGNRLYRDNLVNATFGEVNTYDGLYQITSFSRGTLNSGKTGVSGTAARTQLWNYDALGNMDSVTTNGVTQSRTANKQNEITSISSMTTPTYDAAGNMTTEEYGRTMKYDSWNRIVEAKSGGTILAAYSYDGLGRRVTVSDLASTKAAYFSNYRQAIEEQVGGLPSSLNIWSNAYIDGIVARYRSTNGLSSLNEIVYAAQESMWSTTSLYATDGSVLERFAYDPFGDVTELSPAWVAASPGYAWPISFQGGVLNSSTGQITFRKRELHPTLMVWNQTDPLLFTSSNPNLYIYVSNNSFSKMDPFGEIPVCVAGIIVGAVGAGFWSLGSEVYTNGLWNVSIGNIAVNTLGGAAGLGIIACTLGAAGAVVPTADGLLTHGLVGTVGFGGGGAFLGGAFTAFLDDAPPRIGEYLINTAEEAYTMVVSVTDWFGETATDVGDWWDGFWQRLRTSHSNEAAVA